MADFPKRFLSVTDLSFAQVREVLDLGLSWKKDPGRWAGALSGRTVALIFEKPSLRTRVSFEAGLNRIGGHPMYLDCANQRIGVRESVQDYARNLERFVDGIVARVFEHAVLAGMAEHCSIPVINALSDEEHPCQSFADMLTLAEHVGGGTLEGLAGKRLAYVGDGNNVCHSLMLAAARLGVTMTVVTPKGFEPDFAVLKTAASEAAASGARIELAHELRAIEGHEAVYTDTWVSMGQDHQRDLRHGAFRGFQIDEEAMALASRGLAAPAVFMHCLPAHRGEEVTDAVIDGPRSVVYDQAENRLHAQVGLMLKMFGAA